MNDSFRNAVAGKEAGIWDAEPGRRYLHTCFLHDVITACSFVLSEEKKEGALYFVMVDLTHVSVLQLSIN